MNEFEPLPAQTAPATPAAPPRVRPEQGFLTRPVLLGYSLPWLAGLSLMFGVVAWYLFWPDSSSQDASQRAFGQNAGFEVVHPSAAPAPLQTGGLSVPADTAAAAGSVPEDVMALIREGREFETANREAITRLSDTVRAQTKVLAALQQQVDGIAKENARLGNLVTVLAVRPAPEPAGHAAGRRVKRSALAGMRLESLQEGMAWVSWQGRTWAVEPGDSLGGVTVQAVNASDRSVTTSAGVLR